MGDTKFSVVAVDLDKEITAVVNTDGTEGFRRAYAVAVAIEKLGTLLTKEYMAPIMKLQNTKLGFLTDKKADGYPEPVVKACLIEAVLCGFQPYGNQFNIIKGNMYGTKEGFGQTLSKIKNFSYNIVPGVPIIKVPSALVDMTVKWTLNGKSSEEKLPIAVRIDQYTDNPDAVIGKATRKARAWLFSVVTGIEVGEAEIGETPYVDLSKGSISKEDLQGLYDMKKDSCSPDQIKNFDRILEKEETTNYKKMRDDLSAL